MAQTQTRVLTEAGANAKFQDKASLDADVAAKLDTPGSALRTSADARYVSQLDGTDKTSAEINAWLAGPTAFGIKRLTGEISLDATLYVPSGITLDATGTAITAEAGCGHMLKAAGQESQVYAPDTLAGTPSTSGGTLAAGAQIYYITAVDDLGGESMPAIVSVATTGSTGSVALTWRHGIVSGARTRAGYRIYGRAFAGHTLLATVAASATSWTDTGAAGSAATMPTTPSTFERTASLAVIGGVWDMNTDGGNGFDVNGTWQSGRNRGHAFDFQKVDGLRIANLKIIDAQKWAVAVADFTDLTTENLTFDTLSDGVHVVGPGNGWRAHNLRGHVGDDLVGLSLVEWPPYAVAEGDIVNVDISGIRGVDAPSAVRMLHGSGHFFDSIVIAGISGDFTKYRHAETGEYTTAAKGVVFVNWDQNSPGRKGGTCKSLILRDVVPDAHQSDVVQLGGTITSAKVVNVRSAYAGKAAVVVSYPYAPSNEPTSIDSLDISGVTLANDTAMGVFIPSTAAGSIAVEALTVRGLNRRGTSINNRGVLIEQGTLGKVRVEDSRVVSDNRMSAGDLVAITAGTVRRLELASIFAQRATTVAYLAGGTCSVVVADDVEQVYCQAAIKARIPTRVEMARPRSTDPVDAYVSLYTAPATPVELVGDVGALAPNATMLKRDGSQAWQPRSFGMPVDVSVVTKAAGLRAYNTNASLSCGVGPVYCNGTVWTHVTTGATY